MNLEVFSDVVSPWCYTGKPRLDQAVVNLTHAGIDLKLEILYRPFQVEPTAPLDTPTPVRLVVEGGSELGVTAVPSRQPQN